MQLGRREDKDSPISSPTMSDHRMESHPCQNEKEEEVTNKIRFLLAMVQWNSRKAKFFKNKEEKSRPSERSGKEGDSENEENGAQLQNRGG